jgi:hypothetical protein
MLSYHSAVCPLLASRRSGSIRPAVHRSHRQAAVPPVERHPPAALPPGPGPSSGGRLLHSVLRSRDPRRLPGSPLGRGCSGHAGRVVRCLDQPAPTNAGGCCELPPEGPADEPPRNGKARALLENVHGLIAGLRNVASCCESTFEALPHNSCLLFSPPNTNTGFKMRGRHLNPCASKPVQLASSYKLLHAIYGSRLSPVDPCGIKI